MDWIKIFAGVLGVALATLWKMQSLQKLARKANTPFVYKNYFRDDILGIISSFLVIPTWQLIFPEVKNVYPRLELFVNLSFIAIGAIGSIAFQKLLGKTQSWLLNKIDKKTDELDALKEEKTDINID